MSNNPEHFVLICSKCKGSAGAASLRTVLGAGLPDGFGLREVECLAGCERPATVGFQAFGKASYLFGDIESSEDVQALITFAHQYRESETGWTSATNRPPALITKTLARLPALRTRGGAC